MKNSAIENMKEAVIKAGGIADAHLSGDFKTSGGFAIMKVRPASENEKGVIVFIKENSLHSLNDIIIDKGVPTVSTYARGICDVRMTKEQYENGFNSDIGPHCFFKDTRLENCVFFEVIGGKVVFSDEGKVEEAFIDEFGNDFIGKEVMAKLGNPTDTSGFEVGVPVKVIAHRQGMVGTVYLVDTGSSYCLAIPCKNPNGVTMKTPLESTVCMPYKFMDINNLSKWMGFDKKYLSKSN